MSKTSPYERAANWNKQRYCRVYSNDLTCNMIDEELEEYFDNLENDVEKLDALCDIMFVAFGALWKMGFDYDDVQLLESDLAIHSWACPDNRSMPSIVLAISFSKAMRFGYIAPKDCLALILALVFEQAISDGYTHDQFKRALLAVCDSNDTKAVERASFDVKANINKGKNYIPPTAALTLIVEEMKNAN